MGWFDEQIEFRKKRERELLSDSFETIARAVAGRKTTSSFRDDADVSDAEKMSDEIALHVSGGALYACDGERYFKFSKDAAPALLKKKIICHDLKKLCRELGTADIECTSDTMIASYLLNPGSGSYPVDKSAFSYLSLPVDATDGAAVCDAVYRLAPVLSDELSKVGMEKLLYEIEIPLSKVLYEMETRGMKVDGEGLKAYSAELSAVRDEYKNRIYALAGHEFNINAPKQLGEVLFEEMGLPCRKKTKSVFRK